MARRLGMLVAIGGVLVVIGSTIIGCRARGRDDDRSREVAANATPTAATPTAATPAPAPADLAADLARIDAIGQEIVDDRWASGLRIVAARDGKLVVDRSFGLATRAPDVAVAADTIFHIGSLTKPFTAVAILHLVERDALGLDTEVRTILPTAPAGVTIRQLLAHTSGVHEYTLDAAFMKSLDARPTAAAIAAHALAQPLNFAPGTSWRYSNSGYILLGQILERITGRGYADVIHDELADAQLVGIGYCPDDVPAGHADGYVRRQGALAPARHVHMAGASSAGALCATAPALVAWADRLFRGQLITAASVRTMTTPFTLVDGTPTAYGLGLQIGALAGHARVGHSGRISGFSAELAYYPSDQLTVVVLANTEGAGATAIADDVARVLFGVPTAPLAERPLDDDARALVGVYALPDGSRATVTIEDARLVLAFADDAWRLAYLGAGEFVDRRWHDVHVRFDARGFAIQQAGTDDVRGTRTPAPGAQPR